MEPFNNGIELMREPVELKEDVLAEIQEFVGLYERGSWIDAEEYFDLILRPHSRYLIVVLHYAEFLRRQGRYSTLVTHTSRLAKMSMSGPPFAQDLQAVFRHYHTLAEAFTTREHTKVEKMARGFTWEMRVAGEPTDLQELGDVPTRLHQNRLAILEAFSYERLCREAVPLWKALFYLWIEIDDHPYAPGVGEAMSRLRYSFGTNIHKHVTTELDVFQYLTMLDIIWPHTGTKWWIKRIPNEQTATSYREAANHGLSILAEASKWLSANGYDTAPAMDTRLRMWSCMEQFAASAGDRKMRQRVNRNVLREDLETIFARGDYCTCSQILTLWFASSIQAGESFETLWDSQYVKDLWDKTGDKLALESLREDMADFARHDGWAVPG